MKKGWNTWNVRSVMSHVRLPDGFAISLGLKTYNVGPCLREALIGKPKERRECVVPGPHAYDGSFTSLEVEWHGYNMRVETAHHGDEWIAQVTPLRKAVKTPSLIIEAAVLWNKPGYAVRDSNRLIIQNDDQQVAIYATGRQRNEQAVVEVTSPYLLIDLDGPICISTDNAILPEVAELLDRKRKAFSKSREAFSEVHNTMQACLAWDTIYDPFKDRVISPVSRIWSCQAGGWVLFDWDTYFAAWMASVEHKELAEANAIAITDEATERGFIPNFAHPSGFKSRDRSQPPVGAITVKAICERWDDTALAKQLFEPLLVWNRWWPEHRDIDGYLCWGSDPYEPITGFRHETAHVNTLYAAALESGLDNSPMYEDMPYDTEAHLMLLADVGLMSFYIADCRALADLAARIGRDAVVAELNDRADHYAENLESLWCEETGLYLNKRLDTGEFEHRLSPTHFYPLLAQVPSQERAERMINEHLLNEDEFWGEWVIPSIERGDPLYPRQRYWQGRIWAPMNFLVYLGLCNYELPAARKALVQKSEQLLLKEWLALGHVHENYNTETGEGCDVSNSDAFYHWGALLGLVSVLEKEMYGQAQA